MGYRWTVSTSGAANLSSLLTLLLTFTLSQLISLVYTLLHVLLLHQKTKSYSDDQAHVIASNSSGPSNLLSGLLKLGYKARRVVTSSTIFWVLLTVALFVLMIQATAVVALGWLFIDTPLPMVLGPWGTPARWPDFNGTNYTFEFNDDAIWIPRQTLLYEQAATRFFQQCNDNGTNIVCPGPIGHAFSWEISESLPSNCWFGSDHCFYGSKTITQRATLSPSDMGILRNNGMSITIAAECSHVNSSGFTLRLVDSDDNSYTNYNFGSASSDPSNRTLTVYDSEALIDPRNYRPFVSTWLQGGLDWVPAPFLTERIEFPIPL